MGFESQSGLGFVGGSGRSDEGVGGSGGRDSVEGFGGSNGGDNDKGFVGRDGGDILS